MKLGLATRDPNGLKVETFYVRAKKVTPHFALHKKLNLSYSLSDTYSYSLSDTYWALTHIPTGYSVGMYFKTPEDATRTAKLLEAQPVDWDTATPNQHFGELQETLARLVREGQGYSR